MGDFFTIALLTAILRMATPLIFAGMGGLLSERSGVMNIALEGFMLFGAFTGATISYYAHSAWIGLVAGIAAGLAGGLVHAFWCITLRGDQIVAGTAIDLLGLGIPAFLVQRIFGQAGGTPTVDQLPQIGQGMSILVPVAFILVPIIQYGLFRTRAGLHVLACGEHPQAAEAVGIAVDKYRYVCVLLSGVLAGAGGAYLSIGDLSQFTTGMTAGRGFIALAAMIFGNWTPLGTLGACLLFGGAQAVQIQAQAASLPISSDLLTALPYIVTLVAITGLYRRSTAPAGLGKHATAD